MEDWLKTVLKKLQEHSVTMPSGCRQWTGGPSHGICKYGKTRTQFPAISGTSTASQVVYVHRLAYMVSHRVAELPPHLEVSHLCHNPRCVEPEHLCLESHEKNSERISCHLQGMCTRLHIPYCIFGHS